MKFQRLSARVGLSFTFVVGTLRRAVSIALPAAVLGAVLAGCQRSPSVQAPTRQAVKPTTSAVVTTTEKTPDSESDNVIFQKPHMVWSDTKGRTLCEADFKSASLLREKDAVIELHDVTAHLYKSGVPASVLRSPHVIAYAKTHKIMADGGVTVQATSADASYSSQRVTWTSSDNKIVGTGNVKMVKKNMSVIANSFTADTALQSVDFADPKLKLE